MFWELRHTLLLLRFFLSFVRFFPLPSLGTSGKPIRWAGPPMFTGRSRWHKPLTVAPFPTEPFWHVYCSKQGGRWPAGFPVSFTAGGWVRVPPCQPRLCRTSWLIDMSTLGVAPAGVGAAQVTFGRTDWIITTRERSLYQLESFSPALSTLF